MKRYYYTCPLQAAYMAKEFGMSFDIYHPVSKVRLRKEESEHRKLAMMGEHIFILRTESLEPRVGDILDVRDEYGFHFGRVIKIGGNPTRLGFLRGDGLTSDMPIVDPEWSIYYRKTIQRNGKLFFWPEVEG